MKTIFSALNRFAYKMLPTEFKTAMTTEKTKLLEWAYAQSNDCEIWGAEPAQERITAASKLNEVDPAAAFRELLILAERGSVWSMVLVGYRYEVGQGVPLDIEQAERWYRLAVGGGSQQAQLRLGRIYQRRKDFTRAEEVFQIGTAQKWAPAMYQLARCKLMNSRSRQALAAARLLLEAASAKGDLQAEDHLALLITKGCFGIREIPSGWRRYQEVNKKIAVQLGEAVPCWYR